MKSYRACITVLFLVLSGFLLVTCQETEKETLDNFTATTAGEINTTDSIVTNETTGIGNEVTEAASTETLAASDLTKMRSDSEKELKDGKYDDDINKQENRHGTLKTDQEDGSGVADKPIQNIAAYYLQLYIEEQRQKKNWGNDWK